MIKGWKMGVSVSGSNCGNYALIFCTDQQQQHFAIN